MTSDLHIPRTTDILDRALDIRASAVRLRDDQAVRQIDRLIVKLPEARMCWVLGVLHIASPSGNTYHVTRAGCDCTNGRFHKGECWHWTLYNMLLDIFSTDCDTADQDADADALPVAQPWYHRAPAACWAGR